MTTSHKIIISCGDMAGIGWPILKKLIKNSGDHFTSKHEKKLSQIIVIGDINTNKEEEKYLETAFYHQAVSEDEELSIDNVKSLPQNQAQKISKNNKPLFLSLGRINVSPGKASLKTARRSYLYIRKAIELWKSWPNSSLLTLPVSKEMIIKSGTKFVGHTEELKNSFGMNTYMCMYHPQLSVIPLTNHIPLKKVASQIKKVNFDDVAKALSFFQDFFRPKVPMAMLGLNPHAGEGGKIGNEESFLKKQLHTIKKKRIRIEGLFPADGFFTAHFRKNYSLAVACYHDQGLIPFKALHGTDGINITLNLPKLRVSPDHGPAYSLASLANLGNADITSIRNSLLFCLERGEAWIKHFSCQS